MLRKTTKKTKCKNRRFYSFVNSYLAPEKHFFRAAYKPINALISCNNCFEQIKQGKGVSCAPLAAQPVESFFPQVSEMVPAGPPHPPGTGYQVSIGLERWDFSFIPVIKVQMVQDGNIVDRAPSFPLGSDDHQKVNKALTDLLAKYLSNTPQK